MHFKLKGTKKMGSVTHGMGEISKLHLRDEADASDYLLQETICEII